MARTCAQIPHPSTALHLYRHLLRESTYLPPLARPWAAERIKTRFRANSYEREPRHYISDAHRQLRFLRAANAGDTACMLRVCRHALGRLGKRKRQLAAAYLTKEPPVDAIELAKNSARPATNRPTWLENWDLDKIKALGNSQYTVQTHIFPTNIRRTVDPKAILKEKNCWGLPLKPTQVTNKLKRHYASILSSLMPPLPQGEWDLLRSLCLGEAPASMWKIPSRRPVAQMVAAEDTHGMTRWNWEVYATQPIRKVERGRSRGFVARSGLSLGEDPRGHHAPPLKLHTYKPRYLRRAVYGNLWGSSPLMNEKKRPDNRRQWTITWGKSQPVAPSAKSSQLPFFRGLNGEGKPTTRVGPT